MARPLIPGKYLLIYQNSSGGFLRGGFEHYKVFGTAMEVRTSSTNKKISQLYKHICKTQSFDKSVCDEGRLPVFVLKCNKMHKHNSSMYYFMSFGGDMSSTNGYEDLIGNYETVAVGPIEENNDKWTALINQIKSMDFFDREFEETGVVPTTASYIMIKDEHKHIIKNGNPQKYYFRYISAVAHIQKNGIDFED